MENPGAVNRLLNGFLVVLIGVWGPLAFPIISLRARSVRGIVSLVLRLAISILVGGGVHLDRLEASSVGFL